MALEWYFCTVDKLRSAPLGYKASLKADKPISFIRECYGSNCSNHAMSQIHQSSQWQLYNHVHVTDSVVSRQVFGGTGQIETRFKKPRRVETGFETTQNLIHSSK